MCLFAVLAGLFPRFAFLIYWIARPASVNAACASPTTSASSELVCHGASPQPPFASSMAVKTQSIKRKARSTRARR